MAVCSYCRWAGPEGDADSDDAGMSLGSEGESPGPVEGSVGRRLLVAVGCCWQLVLGVCGKLCFTAKICDWKNS